MADIYGSHFEYGGVQSSNYNLIFARIETERFVRCAGNIDGIYVNNKKDKRRYLVGDDYSDSPVSMEVEIITDDDSLLSVSNQHAITKWLFNRSKYRKLYFDVNDDCNGEMYETVGGVQKRYYMNCRFVNPSRIEGNGGVIGYRATLEADSGYFWVDETEVTFPLTLSGNNDVERITVSVNTDIDDYVYPLVTVKMNNSGGGFSIVNETDSATRTTVFENIGAGATVIFGGDENYVSGQYYEKFTGCKFVRLLDGNNSIAIRGNASEIKFAFSNRRFM